MQSHQSINQEIRLHSENKEGFNWLVGGFYNNRTAEDKTDFVFALPDGTLSSPIAFTDQKLSSNQIAAFGEASYRVSDKASITAGLRYSMEEREQEEYLTAVLEALQLLGIDEKRSNTYSNLSPQIKLSVFPTPNSVIYAAATNGFRNGMIQTGSSLVSALPAGITIPEYSKTESIWNYELGFKLASAKKKVSLRQQDIIVIGRM